MTAHRFWPIAVVAAAALVACEQRRTTVQTPEGTSTSTGTSTGTSTTTTTTTTLGVTPEAKATLQQAASDAARAAGRLGTAASNLTTDVEAKTPGAVRSASGALAKAGAQLADAAITAKVKAAFLVDVDVKGLSIDVDTDGGAVVLKGTLDSRAQADKAADIARRIDGVTSVDNRLAVKTGG